MKRVWLVLILLAVAAHAAPRQAKNVILFLADAGGLPVLHLASIAKYNQPQNLFLQSMPNIALMDTSASDDWVTDSAAGMTAIVTGEKTNKGVISESAGAVRGKQDGAILKTILEYAEERGLATGVASNVNITDATPAACYAHANERSSSASIFSQIFTPRFGDGVDVVIGAGRNSILAATQKQGVNVESSARAKGYAFYSTVKEISDKDKRVIVLLATGDFDVWETTERAIRILSQNKKGYFLMVEWDTHTDNLQNGLRHMMELDETIRKTSRMAGKDTLILFAADHSFDTRLRGGKRLETQAPMTETEGVIPPNLNIRVDNGHTGEQVLAAALGPGAERLHGFIANTDLFHIMMAAYGWEKPRKEPKR